MILDNGLAIESLFLLSETGLLLPETANPAIGDFVQLDDEYVYGAISMSSSLTSGSMGWILPSGLSEATFFADIGVDYVYPDDTPVELVYLTGGRMEGKSAAALPAPEPGTLLLLISAAFTLVLYGTRSRFTRIVAGV
jgi:hypothetical protein